MTNCFYHLMKKCCNDLILAIIGFERYAYAKSPFIYVSLKFKLNIIHILKHSLTLPNKGENKLTTVFVELTVTFISMI